MTDKVVKQLACGCTVQTQRDFLGRVVGTIIERGGQCSRDDHSVARVVVMPGREHACPDDQ